MTAEEFDAWQEAAIQSYAADIARSTGVGLGPALARSREQFAQLLPEGLATERTWLMRVLDQGGSDVGVLWIGPHPTRDGAAFVYDVEIDAAWRGQGLGRAAMQAAEALATREGIPAIGLSVFGFNDGARRLYESLGYQVVATQMLKELAGG
jgi:ribosomal protein S18 acetylase RimI-like enzyme